jgi:uncharacterized protein
MKRIAASLLFCVLLLLSATGLHAEKVADLPLPTHYVNDFAGVLDPETQQSLEDLCLQLHQKANAELAVVTIHTLDDGQSIDDFTGQLEEKWKLGKKGQDRSVIYLLVVDSHKTRIEVGYGLEGILPDAKVGRILDDTLTADRQQDWDQAMLLGTREIAQDIAADANVTLTSTVHHYRREGQPAYSNQGHLSLGQIIGGLLFLGLILVLVVTGNGGWATMLIWSLMGGGGGGGGGRDDDDRGGGGFGGMGGGASGGGGASRDF